LKNISVVIYSIDLRAAGVNELSLRV